MDRFQCIKPACAEMYEGDPEDYCVKCREANKTLAEQVDAKLASSSGSRFAPSSREQIAGMKKIGNIPIINL